MTALLRDGGMPFLAVRCGEAEALLESRGIPPESPVASGTLGGVGHSALACVDGDAVTGGFAAALTRSPVFSCTQEGARRRLSENSQSTSGEVPRRMVEAYSLSTGRVLGSSADAGMTWTGWAALDGLDLGRRPCCASAHRHNFESEIRSNTDHLGIALQRSCECEAIYIPRDSCGAPSCGHCQGDSCCVRA